MPLPAPASRRVKDFLCKFTENNEAINIAMDSDVKNCPYFFLSSFEFEEIKSSVLFTASLKQTFFLFYFVDKSTSNYCQIQ